MKPGRAEGELFSDISVYHPGCVAGTLSSAKRGFNPRSPSHFSKSSGNKPIDWFTCLKTAGEGARDAGKWEERGQEFPGLGGCHHLPHLNALDSWAGAVA